MSARKIHMEIYNMENFNKTRNTVPTKLNTTPKCQQINTPLYKQLSDSAEGNIINRVTVPSRCGLAWELKAGQICRIITNHGPQTGTLNIWNLHDEREHILLSKTREIHRSHLTTYDRLWSSFPYLRPLATVTKDSLSDYGVDAFGCSVHDMLGSQCDPYTYRLQHGTLGRTTCHQNLLNSVQSWGIQEHNIHDGVALFSCAGLDARTREHVVRNSPAQPGDCIEFLAERDLLVALSACPLGDGTGNSIDDCHSLDVVISQPTDEFVEQWRLGSTHL